MVQAAQPAVMAAKYPAHDLAVPAHGHHAGRGIALQEVLHALPGHVYAAHAEAPDGLPQGVEPLVIFYCHSFYGKRFIVHFFSCFFFFLSMLYKLYQYTPFPLKGQCFFYEYQLSISYWLSMTWESYFFFLFEIFPIS